MSENRIRVFENGLLGRQAFSSQAIFDSEIDRIFSRTWILVGHKSQIPRVGDFVASRMGPERVLVTRSSETEICVLLNTCRHKGMRVCRYDEGNTARFTCPYHAWTYANDGSLVQRTSGDLLAVQAYKEAYDGQLDKSAWGLIRARVETLKGAIFANWDPDAPSLSEYLGPVARYLEVLFGAQDGGDGETEVVGGILKWRLRANWKVCHENFSTDPLHNVSHSSTEAVSIGPGGGGGTRHGQASKTITSLHDFSLPQWGHGCFAHEPRVVTEETADFFPQFVAPVGPADDPDVVQEHYRGVARRRLERLKGMTQVAGPMVIGGVFPNMSFHTTFPRTIAVWHPISPTETEGWRWCLVDRDAPPEVKATVRHHFMRYSGPAGMTEEDDTENWSYLTKAAQSRVAQAFPYNYQARLGCERPCDALEGMVTTDSFWTEGNIRTFYSAWQRHLNAENWKAYQAAYLEDETARPVGIPR